MGCDDDILSTHDVRPNVFFVIGLHTPKGIFQAFPAGRRDIKRPAPQHDLLLTPALPGFIFVEAGKLAVVAFVEVFVARNGQRRLVEFREHDVERVLRSLQFAGKSDFELNAFILDHAAGDAGFDQTLLCQVGVLPASKQVEAVPLAFAVADKNQHIVGQRVCHVRVLPFLVMTLEP